MGAFLLTMNYSPISFAAFQKDAFPLTSFCIVDAEGNGKIQYMAIGAWSSPFTLFNDSGEKIFSFKIASGENGTAAADMNNDGKLEFIVPCNGNEGVYLLDNKGTVVWHKKDYNVWHAEIADADNDGGNEIITSNAAGELVVYKGNGDIAFRKKPRTGAYFAAFGITKYPTDTSNSYLLIPTPNKIIVMNFDGETQIAEFEVPGVENIKATLIQFQKAQSPCLVILGTYSQKISNLFSTYAILYIINSQQKIIYHEIYSKEESGEGLCKIPSNVAGQEKLLGGGNGKIWEYSFESPN
jgi:hypothetical protein